MIASTDARPVHLLIDGYRQIACGDGTAVPPGDDDTSTVAKVTCLACLRRGFELSEALTEAISVRLVELGGDETVKRNVGGVVFECVRAGLWITADRRHAIVEQMSGRVEHEWLLFRTNRHELSADPIAEPFDLEDADFWSGWQIGHHFTMGELAHDVATEFLTGDQIERVRRAMIGVPRKTSHHRAILA